MIGTKLEHYEALAQRIVHSRNELPLDKAAITTQSCPK